MTRSESNKAYYYRNRDKIEAKRSTPEYNLRTRAMKYSLTTGRLDAMIKMGCKMKMSGSVCGGALCVDHDHKCCPGKKSCGKCVRGILCINHNRIVAQLEHDWESTMYAINVYLGGFTKHGMMLIESIKPE